MDCTPPETRADVAAWRADNGWPTELYDAADRLEDTMLDGAPGCPTMNTNGSPWSLAGGCTTRSGYLLELDGYGGGGTFFDATITPTDAEGGSLSTGAFRIEHAASSSGTGA